MPDKIDSTYSRIDFWDWNIRATPINELKNWIDEQIKQGKTNVRIDIELGYYSDIDSVVIKSE